MKKTLTLLLVACMLLSLLAGCGGQTDPAAGTEAPANTDVTGPDATAEVPEATEIPEEKQLKDLVYTGTRDISTINIFNNANSGTFKTIVNLYDTLVACDAAGNLIPGLAESWTSDEAGTTWTFTIREGASWVNYKGEKMADVVASDWLWGLEWVLNFWKNDSYNTAEPMDVVAGAEDYYNYTQGLSEEEAKALDLTKFLEMVGIEAPDDHTLVYHLKGHCSYFASLVTCLGFYSVSGDMLAELGVDGFKAVSYDKAWYSGPYMLTEWVANNEKVMTKNPLYWDTESKIFDSITILMVESEDVAYQMFTNGEIQDMQRLSSSTVKMIRSDPSNPYYNNVVQGPNTSASWFMYFNYAKNNADGTPDENWNKAAANEAFRQCFYYGVDLTNYLYFTDSVNPMGLINSTVTAFNISKFSDGTDYTDHVLEKIGVERSSETYPHMDADKLAAYKAQATEELTAQGVTFPITVELWTGSSQSNIDNFTIIKECIEDSLGTDFVTVNIHSYVSSREEEVTYPSLQSIAIDGYGATYMDPLSYLAQLVSDTEGVEAEMSGMYGNINDCEYEEVVSLFDEYTAMVRKADALTDPDARLEGFAEAEAFAINHALLIPTRAARNTYLTCVNWYTKPVSTNDFQSGRWVGMETNTDIYTTDDYLAAYNSSIGK